MNPRFTIPLMIFFVALGHLPLAVAGEGGGIEDGPRLTVRGEAILQVPADQLRLSIGVATEAREAEAALEENSVRMEAVVKALQGVGLTKEEFQTGRFEIQPRWSPRPRQAPPEWRPRIVGYSVTNRLRIKTTQIDLAGKLIGAASAAGANTVDSITFDLASPRHHREEAIEAATANAIADARSLANAASVRLVRVLSLTLDQAREAPIVVRPAAMREGMAMEMASAVPPIESGDVTVRAGVSVVYEIAGKE